MNAYDEGIDLELLAEFVDESLEGLDTVGDLLVTLESHPDNLTTIQDIFRPVHSIKGNAAYFGLLKTKALAHNLETVLDMLRKEALAATASITTVLLQGIDALRSMLAGIREGEAEVQDEEAFAGLLHAVERVADGEKADEESLWKRLLAELQGKSSDTALVMVKQLSRLSSAGRKAVQAQEAAAAESLPESSADRFREPVPEKTVSQPTDSDDTSESRQSGKTMRIPEESIDAFLSHVGDLVTVGEMYANLQGKLAGKGDTSVWATEMRRINEAFDSLSHSLQGSIMNIRKVPMNKILQRAPRTIRDVATTQGKQIDVQVKGGEIPADKSLVGALDAPLSHLLRNAADHGIEGPEERQQAGKPAQGRVVIEVEETPDDIWLKVQDDGRGLDRKALQDKAEKLGLLSQNAPLREADIDALIFVSGLSAARAVTDISGRGVGMDVVKHSIEEMGGQISVSSSPGTGCIFSIRLPKTVSTQIIHGFIVAVGTNRYVFPLENVLRCFSPKLSDLITVQGKGACVQDGDRLIPFFRMQEFFGQRSPEIKAEVQQKIVVVVQAGDQTAGILVDATEGVRQVVLKDIEGLWSRNGLFQGCAIMGDGSVAIIVDVARMVECIECS